MTTVTVQRLVEDGQTAGWVVDIADSPLPDTSSRFYHRDREDEARKFAARVADLIIAGDPITLEDDVL